MKLVADENGRLACKEMFTPRKPFSAERQPDGSIDSSHTVKFRNDVCDEFLEILPRLKPGVWVHVHDIFFPHDYPAEWLIEQRLALNEQYLLEAFLSYNTAFSVSIANHWLSLEHPSEAAHLWEAVTTEANRVGSASFWMTRQD